MCKIDKQILRGTRHLSPSSGCGKTYWLYLQMMSTNASNRSTPGSVESELAMWLMSLQLPEPLDELRCCYWRVAPLDDLICRLCERWMWAPTSVVFWGQSPPVMYCYLRCITGVVHWGKSGERSCLLRLILTSELMRISNNHLNKVILIL